MCIRDSIEGDGTGRDIWKASQRVFDAAVEKAYGGKRKVEWYEVLAGEKSYRKSQEWLPDDTVKATVDFRVSIKGPLTTPVGGGIRSLNAVSYTHLSPESGLPVLDESRSFDSRWSQ